MRSRPIAAFAVLAALAVLGLSTDARAQTAALIPIRYQTYVAFNPLAIPFDIVSAELESGVAPGITVGGQASYTSFDHDRYTTFDLKVRYYPGEIVLRGFSLGASIGRTHLSTPSTGATGGTSTRATLDFPSLGLNVDYNWLLGLHRRFVVGTGVGAKRVLASAEDRDRVNLDRAYVTARFVIGIAF